MKLHNTRPAYCDGDHNAHKKLLSARFRCSQLELHIFRQLCEAWSEEISYTKFLQQIQGYGDQPHQMFRVLLRKLERAGFATLRTRYNEHGKHVPDKIILSNLHDPFLVQSKIEEHYYRMYHNSHLPYLLTYAFRLSDEFIEQHVINVTLADLYSMHSRRYAGKAKICMLHVYGTAILLSVSAFNHFYLATQHKVRGYLQEARTIAELKKSYTQFVNADIIHRYINSNEHEKIEDITAHLLKNKVHFGDVSPSSRQHLFQAVTILNYIHKSYIEFRIQAQMQTKRFSADFESIYNKVYNVPGYIMPIATYRQLLSDYEKIWQQEFHHNVIKLHTNSSVNPIFISEDSVIHKERFKEYLSAHVTEMMNAIYKDLVDDMHTRILNRDLILALRYNNLSNMETLVLRLMKQKYAIMHHILLYYPHYYKKLLRRKIARHEFKATSEEIKRELPPEAFTHSAAHVAKERSKTPANNNAEQESDNEKSENEGESGNQSDSASNSESRNENESDSESNEGEKESQAPNKEARVLTTDKEPHVLTTEPRARNREPRYMMLFMLSLDPLRIFLGACRKLSLMRRLFYRLTSEYMDLHSHFKFLATVVKTQHVKHFPISRDARAGSSEESAA